MVNGERGSGLRRVAGLVAGVGALGLLLGGVATATIPTSTTGQVAACYRVSSGALRVIDVQKGQRCGAGERLLTWGPSWVWRGAYNPKAAYAPGSVVVVNGSSYVARVAVPKGRAPSGTGTSYWGLLASVSAHNHDDRYSTEAEVATALSGKANVIHNHNDVYYTKDEVNGAFGLTRLYVDYWKPVAFGHISENGGVMNSTPGLTSRWIAANGWYEITIPGVTYSSDRYVTIVTTVWGFNFSYNPTTGTNGGKLIVAMTERSEFSFVTFAT